MSMESAFKDLAGGGFDDFVLKPKSQQKASASATKPSSVQLERLADVQGFSQNNNPIQRKALRSGRVASRERPQPMSLRIRVEDWNKFSAFCERNNYSVAEGFAALAELTESL